MNLSFWEKETFFKAQDCCIIGAGLVGLNAAIHYQTRFPKKKITVIDRGIIPSGASTKNAGFACFGSISELIDDLNHSTESEVFSLVEKRWKGLELLKSTVGEKNMNFQQLGGYELFLDKDEDLFVSAKEKMDYFNKAIQNITGFENTYSVSKAQADFGFQKTKGMIFNRLEGQLHPGKMIQVLLKKAESLGVSFLFGASLERLEKENNKHLLLLNSKQKIITEKVIIATNGFALDLIPDLEILPARNQVIVSQAIPNLPFKGTFHYDQGYYYFRNIGNRILLGGGRNLSPQKEQTSSFGITEEIQNNLEEMLNEVIFTRFSPKIEFRWSGILGVGKIKKPILKNVENGLTVAVRLGGMGVALGSMLGQEAAELNFQS